MELLRRAVRSVVSFDSTFYRTASSIYNSVTIALKEGPKMVCTLNRLALARPGEPEPVQLKNLDHPIFIRPGTPDAGTVVTNIIREDHGQMESRGTPVTMIDAGAYIGDSSAYFLSRYPELQVVSLEPDPGNHQMASKNLEPYGERVQLFNQALSAKPGIVNISGKYDGAGISENGVEIEATTIPDIMEKVGWDSISILKVDIEGEEINVLDEIADTWLMRVDLLIVEIHGAHIEPILRKTLERNGFSMSLHRTSWFCLKEHRC